MKKSLKGIIAFGLLIAILITTIAICAFKINVYKLSPVICTVVLNCSPEEFYYSGGKDTNLENAHTFSALDKEGNLILVLTDKEKEDWKNHIYDPVLNSARESDTLEVSDDYTKCSVRCYKETAIDEMWTLIVVLPEYIFFQVLDGKDSNDTKVECSIFDAGTGELKRSFVYPGDGVAYYYEKDYFSSKYDDVNQ